jgi:hypothetical protein
VTGKESDDTTAQLYYRKAGRISFPQRSITAAMSGPAGTPIQI